MGGREQEKFNGCFGDREGWLNPNRDTPWKACTARVMSSNRWDW